MEVIDKRIAFGDNTKLDPWSVLVTNLIQDFDANELLFTEIRNLSKYQLGSMASCIKDARQYFDVLENNLNIDDLLEFLINLMNYKNFHQDLYYGGARIADILMEHRVKFQDYKRQRMRQNVYDENYVGREEEIEELIAIMMSRTSQYRGVNICGRGGVGKSTLANEICRRLWASSQQWIFMKIDLRERKTMFDFLRDACLKVIERSRIPRNELVTAFKDMTEEDLQDKLIDAITKEPDRMALLLDNLDDIIDRNEQSFLQFTRNLLQQMQNSKVRIIITSRQKLNIYEDYTDEATDHRKLLFERKVMPLKFDDAKQLFTKCTRKDQTSDMQCEEIVTLCGCMPLAIRTVSSTLKSKESLQPSDMIHCLRQDQSSLIEFNVCLKETFRSLNKQFQSVILQLCIFKTAEFDIQAANAVLSDVDRDHNIKETNEIAILRTKFQLLHLKSRHMIEMHDQSIQNEESDNEIDTVYSIHPLVYDFLQRLLRDDCDRENEFLEDVESAKQRFIIYYKKIIDNLSDAMDSGTYEFHSVMRDNRVHISIFFDALSTVRIPKSGSRKNILSQNRGLAYLLNLCSTDEHGRAKRSELLKKWTEEARNERNWQDMIYWRAEMMVSLSEGNKLRQIENFVSDVHVTDLEHSAKTATEYAILGRHYNALAQYYKNRERGGQRFYKNLKQADHWYWKATQENASHTLKTDLADICNSIGCYFFALQDTKTAKEYHEKAFNLCIEYADSNSYSNIPVFLSNLGACLFKEGIQLEREHGKGNPSFKAALDHFTQAINLDRESNMDQNETLMDRLLNRAMIYVYLEEFEKAKSDAWTVVDLRKKRLSPGHPKLTISVAKQGEIMYRWSLKERNKDDGYKHLREAEKYYTEAMHMIGSGSLNKDNSDYPEIKRMHIKVLNKLQDEDRLKAVDNFYMKCEVGNCEGTETITLRRKSRRSNTDYQNNIRIHSDDSSSSYEADCDTDDDITDSESPATTIPTESTMADGKDAQVGACNTVEDNVTFPSSFPSRPSNLPLKERIPDDEVFLSPSAKQEKGKSPGSHSLTMTSNTIEQGNREEMSSSSSADCYNSRSCISSSSLSSQISVTENTRRPSLQSAQSSSVEDNPFGQPARMASAKRLKRQDSICDFIDNKIRSGRKARRESWISSSADSSSLSIDGDIEGSSVSVYNYMQLKSERSGQRGQRASSVETQFGQDEKQPISKRKLSDSKDSGDSKKKFKPDDPCDAADSI